MYNIKVVCYNIIILHCMSAFLRGNAPGARSGCVDDDDDDIASLFCEFLAIILSII